MLGRGNKPGKLELEFPNRALRDLLGHKRGANQSRVAVPILADFKRRPVQGYFHAIEDLRLHGIDDLQLHFVASAAQRGNPDGADFLRAGPATVMLRVIPIFAFYVLPHIDQHFGDLIAEDPALQCNLFRVALNIGRELLVFPIPSGYTVTGVPVSIDAIDPSGGFVHIADVTTDISGSFGYMWKPTQAGEYKVTATFAGDDSYGYSFAETTIGVVEAPAVTPPPEVVVPDYTMTITAATIAIIIAVAIVGLLVFLALRKR